ncbi:MAG: hypothetical protein ACR2GO_05485 [Candidatus Limnocylindria bacterium]
MIEARTMALRLTDPDLDFWVDVPLRQFGGAWLAADRWADVEKKARAFAKKGLGSARREATGDQQGLGLAGPPTSSEVHARLASWSPVGLRGESGIGGCR